MDSAATEVGCIFREVHMSQPFHHPAHKRGRTICIVYKDSRRLYNVYIVCIRLYVMCMEERLSFYIDVTIKYVVKKENLNLLFLNLYFIKKQNNMFAYKPLLQYRLHLFWHVG